MDTAKEQAGKGKDRIILTIGCEAPDNKIAAVEEQLQTLSKGNQDKTSAVDKGSPKVNVTSAKKRKPGHNGRVKFEMEEWPDSEDKPQVTLFPDLEIVLEPGTHFQEQNRLAETFGLIFRYVANHVFSKLFHIQKITELTEK